MTTSPILCFAPGSCARVPLIALEEIGQPYDLRAVAFMAGEHRRPDYLAINPSGKVPALIVEGEAIAQNSAILYYLARRHPEAGLLPEATDLLAQARQIAELARFSSDLHPLVTRIRMPQFFASVEGAPADVRAKGCEAMEFQMAGINEALSGRDWYLASGWSVLDAYLFWVWFRITGAGFDASPYSHITRHHERMLARPSVQRALAREAEVQADLEVRGLAVPLA